MIKCPYNCGEFRQDLGILVCRPTGELTSDRAADIAVCRECLEKAGLPHVNRFHDMTGITVVHLDFENIRRICEAEAAFRKAEHPVKACYLVHNSVLFGTVRMYQALAESRGVSVHVSYNLQELADVLGVDASKLATEQSH